MRVSLDYGSGELDLYLPAQWRAELVVPRDLPVLLDPEAAVTAALAAPLAAAPLPDLVRGRQSACILIPDPTRPAPLARLLNPLVRALLEAGLRREQITVLIATAHRRPTLGYQLAEHLADDWVPNLVEVVNHFARRGPDHLDLGESPGGIRYWLDRRLVQAELKLAVGVVAPDPLTGFSGGPALLAPGVAHQDTIAALYRRAGGGEAPEAPDWTEAAWLAERLGGVASLEVALDAKGRPGLVCFGGLLASHRAVVGRLAPRCGVAIARRRATVVASAGGYPHDQSLDHALDALPGALGALAPGGRLFLAAACAQGLGSPRFRAALELIQAAGPAVFQARLAGGLELSVEEWRAARLWAASRQGSLRLYAPSLSAADRDLAGVETVDSLGAAVRSWLEVRGERDLAVLPHGAAAVPRLAAAVSLPPAAPAAPAPAMVPRTERALP